MPVPQHEKLILEGRSPQAKSNRRMGGLRTHSLQQREYYVLGAQGNESNAVRSKSMAPASISCVPWLAIEKN